MSGPRAWLTRAVTAAEHALDRRIGAALRNRSDWAATVVPYHGHGTSTLVRVRARVVVRRRRSLRRGGPAATLLTGLSHYLSAEVAGEPVTVRVADQEWRGHSDAEGYVDATLQVSDLFPGWHDVTFRLAEPGEPSTEVAGRVLVVDPEARLGLVSDMDDTIIHTGLTRLREAVRTTLLVAEEERVPIAGAAELYAALVVGDGGRAPVFYVSTGAWNLHSVLERFLIRHRFPTGPMVMTDWGPGGRWLFREGSVDFKSRTIIALMAEHPRLRWVLVGDSGQHDPEAYAAVVRARPGRVHAVYIREVLPQSPLRGHRVRTLAAELERLGTPMLLIGDSAAAAEHAHGLGLLDAAQVDDVRRGVAAG